MDDIDDILDKLEEDETNMEHRDADVERVDRLESFLPSSQENCSNGILDREENGHSQLEISNLPLNGEFLENPILVDAVDSLHPVSPGTEEGSGLVSVESENFLNSEEIPLENSEIFLVENPILFSPSVPSTVPSTVLSSVPSLKNEFSDSANIEPVILEINDTSSDVFQRNDERGVQDQIHERPINDQNDERVVHHSDFSKINASENEITELVPLSFSLPATDNILPSDSFPSSHPVSIVNGISADPAVGSSEELSAISPEKIKELTSSSSKEPVIHPSVDAVQEEKIFSPTKNFAEEKEKLDFSSNSENFQIFLPEQTSLSPSLSIPNEESTNFSTKTSNAIQIPTKNFVGFQPASWGAVDDVSDSELEQFLNSLGETEGTSLSAELKLLPSEENFFTEKSEKNDENENEFLNFSSELRASPPLEMAPPIPMTLVDVTEFMDQEGPFTPLPPTEIQISEALVDFQSNSGEASTSDDSSIQIPENLVDLQSNSEKTSKIEESLNSDAESELASTNDDSLIQLSMNSSQNTEPNPPDYLVSPSGEEENSFRNVSSSFIGDENASPNQNQIPATPAVIFSADNLGKIKPEWVPDEFAPICMLCGVRFNMVKRRHHCRACGSVICASCGNYKARLDYLEMREDRICALCNETFQYRNGGDQLERNEGEQADDNLRSPSPVIVASFNGPQPPGVLRRQDQPRRERRNVVFFDGIRPGGDLMEPEFHGNGRRLAIMNAKRQRRSPGGPPEAPTPPKSRSIPKKSSANHVIKLFVNRDILPVMEMTKDGHYVIHETPDLQGLLEKFAVCPSETVDFYVNLCLRISVQIVDLQCCMNVIVWSYVTSGMRLVGQDEIVVLLVKQDDDSLPPRDVFIHLNEIFLHAKQGHVIGNLGHSIVALGGYDVGFLGNRNNAGFLFIRQSYQCVSSLKLPEQPYLFGILMTKWEVPWAKMFPLRLMLRLGTEYRYYPCPLISFRNRKPVFEEVGHTVMNLLCDFRNFQYHLPCVEDTECCMEKGVITVRFPRHRYDQIVKLCQGSNEHVLAIGLGFSKRADAHLVCVQNLENGQYETQAINIQSKGRKVTGTSFVIFNASLKGIEALECRAAVVEDGIMAQINLRGLEELKMALKAMRNITFKAIPKTDDTVPVEQETIVIEWTNDSKTCNAGVRSPIDGKDMTGIESRRVSLKHSMDFLNGTLAVRCTEVFLTDEKDTGMVYREEIDVSRLAENLAMASCSVLRTHLYDYRDGGATKIALRVCLGPDTVEYEVGAKGERFPPQNLAEFDEKIMPLIYECARVWGVRPRLELELIFRVFQH